MTSTVSVEWVCDRCDATMTMASGKQPADWHRMIAANPPQHAEPERQGDICIDCWRAFCRWWSSAAARSGPPPERAPRPEPERAHS